MSTERRRRWSDTYKGVPDSDDEGERVNGLNGDVDPQLRREEQELAKIESGIAQVTGSTCATRATTTHDTT